jgi:predicted dehydrogenase
MTEDIGVAVIGAGMAGAPTPTGTGRPERCSRRPATVRLVSVADINDELAADTARRYGFERSDSSWQAIVKADDIDVVSVVVANHLHREIVEALAAAGKHVLCEKPLAPTSADAQAMVEAVDAAGVVARVGFTFRRTPGIAAARDVIRSGELGRPLYVNAQYWTDYGSDPQAPMSWRYRGGPGSGALADLGSHLAEPAEFLLGPVESVTGAALTTVIGERPKPLGHVVGHAHVEVSDEREPVDNDDWASFSVRFAAAHRRPERVPHRVRPPEHAEVRGLLRARRRSRSTSAGQASSRSPRARPASDASSSASTTPTSQAAWPWTPPASAPATTTASSTRPARSSTRSPDATNYPATPPSPKDCTPCS